MPYRQNTVFVQYRYTQGEGAIRLGLRPGIQFRNHDAMIDPDIDTHVHGGNAGPAAGSDIRAAATRRLRLKTTPAGCFTYDPKIVPIDYPIEKHRGYPYQGLLWSPGIFAPTWNRGFDGSAGFDGSLGFDRGTSAMKKCREAELGAETRHHRLRGCERRQRAGGAGACRGPVSDYARRAPRDVTRGENLSVIAGYHWFTDWGRDTMISLEGLTLATGRHQEARWILRTFAHYVRDGLIPNMFPEGEKQGLYHTADASLWFFHALSRYLAGHRRPRDAAGDSARTARDRGRPHRGHAVRHPRRSGGRPAGAGRRRLSADVDGREGGRLGGDSAAREGGGDQCALVQRALSAQRLARRGGGRGCCTPHIGTCAQRARAIVQPAVLESAARLSVRCGGWRSAEAPATMPRAVPTSFLRFRSRIRCSTRMPLAPVVDAVDEISADAGGPAVAGARRAGLSEDATTAICGPATRRIIRDPCGPG